MKTEIIKCDRCKKECDEFVIRYSYRELIPYSDETKLVELEFCNKKCAELFLFGTVASASIRCAAGQIWMAVPKRINKKLRDQISNIIDDGEGKALKLYYPDFI